MVGVAAHASVAVGAACAVAAPARAMASMPPSPRDLCCCGAGACYSGHVSIAAGAACAAAALARERHGLAGGGWRDCTLEGGERGREIGGHARVKLASGGSSATIPREGRSIARGWRALVDDESVGSGLIF